MTERQQAPAEDRNRVSQRQFLKLLAIPVFMFGFGFALVPLYDVFCEVTGLNGKTGRIDVGSAQAQPIDDSRSVTVKFLAIEGTGLPWSFEPLVHEMTVHPGQIYEAAYRVSNRSGRDTVGQAVPSVSPGLASRHFNKTECFCFSRQELAAGETRDMPLRFVIDRGLPEGIVEVTLSYTFFDISKQQG